MQQNANLEAFDDLPVFEKIPQHRRVHTEAKYRLENLKLRKRKKPAQQDGFRHSV